MRVPQSSRLHGWSHNHILTWMVRVCWGSVPVYESGVYVFVCMCSYIWKAKSWKNRYSLQKVTWQYEKYPYFRINLTGFYACCGSVCFLFLFVDGFPYGTTNWKSNLIMKFLAIWMNVYATYKHTHSCVREALPCSFFIADCMCCMPHMGANKFISKHHHLVFDVTVVRNTIIQFVCLDVVEKKTHNYIEWSTFLFASFIYQTLG